MRSIQKGATPQEYVNWLSQTASIRKESALWDIPTDIKNAIKSAMLIEQGYLCAYTMRRIEVVNECHIEHIEARNTNASQTFDFANMAACVPLVSDKKLGYGAPVKDGTLVLLKVNFLSPHSNLCDVSFDYAINGSILAIGGHSSAADNTIDILKLNHSALMEIRKGAYRGRGILLGSSRLHTTKHKKLTAKAARRLAQEVLQLNNHGKLEPFCAAIANLALKYAEREEKRAQRIDSAKRN